MTNLPSWERPSTLPPTNKYFNRNFLSPVAQLGAWEGRAGGGGGGGEKPKKKSLHSLANLIVAYSGRVIARLK